MKRKLPVSFFRQIVAVSRMKALLLLLAFTVFGGTAVAQNWNQIVKMAASDRSAGSRLGQSVAISGDYAVVGAPGNGSGSAYIFKRNGTTWVEQQKIIALDANSDDNFGTSVAISGDYIVVGAIYDNENASGGGALSDAGSAYIFKRTGTTWAQEQKIVPSDRADGDYFGSTVAISGDYVAVGAFLSNPSGLADAGAAYVFKRTGTSWAQEQKITAPDMATNDNFGCSVAISGDYVIAGSVNDGEDAAGANTLAGAGSAYVFKRTGTTWAQEQKIVPSDRATTDSFGFSVAISGDDVVIGAVYEDENASGTETITNAGSAYIFKRTGVTWAQEQKLVASDRGASDNFGRSVSISGDCAIIGSPFESEDASGAATLSLSGSAYAFKRTGVTWAQVTKMVASDRSTEDLFGYSVAVSGSYVISGALYEDENAAVAATLTDAGSAYIFSNCSITGGTAVANVSCNSGTNGAINLTPSGGTLPYAYSWAGGVTTEDRAGLSAGVYSVTITDANGCVGTASATVTQPTAVNGSTIVTNIACNGGNTGSINLTPNGGTPGYTFSWGGGITTEDRTGLAAGTYSVTITDANSCTRTVNATVTQSPPVSGTITVTNVSCNGGSNGVIDLTPTGGTPGYTYSWGGGITTQDRILLATGTYSVTITDVYACTGTVSATVTQPTAVSGTTTITNLTCNGGSNGTIDLTPTGGTPGYTYSWGGGITSQDRISLMAGTYSVTITDANGCTGTVNATATQPAAISGTRTVTNVSCNGGSNGSIDLTPSGGTPGYTYSWGGGITSQDRISLMAGTYSVTITDANACTATVSATVTQPTTVAGTTVVTNVACNSGTNGAINITPTGGTPGYTFSWGGGVTTEDRIGLAAGTYSVTITDANGCTGTASATVTQPLSVVSGTTVLTHVSCNNGTNGTINLTPSGGTPGYTFSWGGGVTTEDRAGLAAGTYTVTITDANGCTGTVSAMVGQPAATVSGTTIVTDVACNGGSNGTINLTPSGGTPGYTYSWGGGITSQDRIALSAGTYSVTITDANGCTGTVSATVTQPGAVASSFSTTSCDFYTLNGTTYTSSGTYTQNLQNIDGCDSTVTLNLTITHSTTSSLIVTECDLYTLNGTTYTTSGVYTQLLQNTAGCDSTLTLNLTITHSTASSLIVTECDSYTLNGSTYTTSGIYTQNLQNTANCDSTVTLNLTITHSTASSLIVTECDSYTLNGSTYTASGVYTQNLQNTANCDSTLTLNLTITHSTASSMTVTECDSYTLNGTTYATSGVYTQDLQNTANCDSTLTLNLTITHSTASSMTVTECDSYTLNGTTYTASGVYTQDLQNTADCDSTLTLNLTILPVVNASAGNNGNGTLSASGGTAYQWINCTLNEPIAGATGQIFEPQTNGSYAVIATNGDCSDTSACVAMTNLKVEEIQLNDLKIYPNPTESSVHVLFTGEAGELFVYDAAGKLLWNGTVASGDTVSLETYETGVYLFELHTSQKVGIQRIIKN